MKKGKTPDNKGFSLIELIVIVLIIGIISTGAVMSFTVVYNADSERAAKRLTTILSNARTEAMTYNDDTPTHKIDVVAFIEQRENGDYYAGVQKKTTQKATGTTSSETVEEVKLANYRVKLIFAKKNAIGPEELKFNTANSWGGSMGRIEYSFKRGTGRLVPSPVGTVTSSDYCDINIEGSENYKLILSTASGKCMIDR